MPIYEYRCRDCAHEFEQYVPSAATAVACPSCATSRVTRKLSVFSLKGESSPVASTMPSGGGGCCGGGCGCH